MIALPPDTSLARVSDPEYLQPAFRHAVRRLMARMAARGHDAIIWETYRTPARAKLLSKRGTGAVPRPDGSIPIGMHQMGLAVDIVSKSKMWTPPKAFWDALGLEAKALGLTWGGTWKRVDRPHIQAVPVAQQNAMRARFKARGYAGMELAAGRSRGVARLAADAALEASARTGQLAAAVANAWVALPGEPAASDSRARRADVRLRFGAVARARCAAVGHRSITGLGVAPHAPGHGGSGSPST